MPSLTDKVCETCAWFLHRDYCREDLQQELINCEHAGYCVEPTNNFFFMPMIPQASTSYCGKHMEDYFDVEQARNARRRAEEAFHSTSGQ